jgi:hypothetical protein
MASVLWGKAAVAEKRHLTGIDPLRTLSFQSQPVMKLPGTETDPVY